MAGKADPGVAQGLGRGLRLCPSHLVPGSGAQVALRKSTPDALSKRDSFIVRITHPTHPLRGQTFVVQPLFGGRPDPTQLLIELPNGERRLIPQAWTDQVTRIAYPPGACFVAERLLLVRQRLDTLLAQAGEQTILMAKGLECDEPGGNHANRRDNPLGAVEHRATSSDHRHSCSDAATSIDPTSGGGA